MLDPDESERWASLERRVERLEDDVADIKQTLKEMLARLTAIELSLVNIQGRIAGLEGRVAGMEFRIGGLPTVWTMLTITFATWGIGSGILIFAINF
jgi:uncharacterized coiled-coil protein SlyX